MRQEHEDEVFYELRLCHFSPVTLPWIPFLVDGEFLQLAAQNEGWDRERGNSCDLDPEKGAQP